MQQGVSYINCKDFSTFFLFLREWGLRHKMDTRQLYGALSAAEAQLATLAMKVAYFRRLTLGVDGECIF